MRVPEPPSEPSWNEPVTSFESEEEWERMPPVTPEPEPEPQAESAGRADALEGEERPSSGRRRGRRSGRGRLDRGGDSGEARRGHGRPESLEERGEPSRRGWGRPRPESEPPRTTDADAAAATEEDEVDTTEPEPVLNDEEMDTLSDWNVPSWNELIASLYRPDR
jgi:hypothetical protein